ncbi:multiple cyclophane-containing RiPP AmcA [Amycolatopsis magusensis]|uniref:multiple cyclophane-containing RiPP AmcA n=1 Tax=Amycolatopsis magusensis TaxID=882444 RepID=UPI00379ECE3B
MPKPSASQPVRRIRACEVGLRGLADRAVPMTAAKFDNRPTWDNAPKFDNRPGWDNWNKVRLRTTH